MCMGEWIAKAVVREAESEASLAHLVRCPSLGQETESSKQAAVWCPFHLFLCCLFLLSWTGCVRSQSTDCCLPPTPTCHTMVTSGPIPGMNCSLPRHSLNTTHLASLFLSHISHFSSSPSLLLSLANGPQRQESALHSGASLSRVSLSLQ